MTNLATKSSDTQTKRRSAPATVQTSPRRSGELKHSRSFKLGRILVPMDFSERSRAALTYAIGFARDFGGSLSVLHVLDPLLAPGRLDSSRLRKMKSSSRSEAEAQLRALRPELIASGVRAQLLVRQGPVAEMIVIVALKVTAHLIIMSSQGRTGLKRLLIGSVAERVVRHSSCPVLVLR